MMTVREAVQALADAYEARDVAEQHAVNNVRREFAAIIHRRTQEYQDAMRREQEASKCAG